jgi:hypothetical protein
MQVCLVIEKIYSQANSNNYSVTVFPDGHWEITKWELDVPQPTTDELQTEWDTMNLENTKQEKINELDDACANAILSKFKATLNGIEYEFAYDSKAQSRFNGTGILFLNNLITEVPWTAYQDGKRVRINLTKDDFNIISLAALAHQNDNISKYSQLYQNVEDETSVDNINKIEWQ